jgi:hypothetical protein
MFHGPATSSDFFDDGSLIFRWDLDGQLFVGLHDVAVLPLQHDFRLRDLELIAFPSHLFDQYRQMQFSTAGDQEPIRAIGLLDPQRDVGLKLFEETLAQVTRREELAFSACKGAGVHPEGHLDGWLIDDDRRQRDRLFRIGNRLADADVWQSRNRDNFTRIRTVHLDPFQAREYRQVRHLP